MVDGTKKPEISIGSGESKLVSKVNEPMSRITPPENFGIALPVALISSMKVVIRSLSIDKKRAYNAKWFSVEGCAFILISAPSRWK